MMDLLTLLFRVILIGIGLLSIAAGGLCTVIGMGQSLEAWWVVLIGIVSIISGGALVRYVFRKWNREASGADRA